MPLMGQSGYLTLMAECSSGENLFDCRRSQSECMCSPTWGKTPQIASIDFYVVVQTQSVPFTENRAVFVRTFMAKATSAPDNGLLRTAGPHVSRLILHLNESCHTILQCHAADQSAKLTFNTGKQVEANEVFSKSLQSDGTKEEGSGN